jgi:hypothetical protein
MGLFIYKVVKHQNGWAYKLEDTYSSVFSTQFEAAAAAKKTAREMHEAGDFTQVKVKDGPLGWRTELVINGRHSGEAAA